MADSTGMPRKDSLCRNCGEPVQLRFCPRCGQAAEVHQRPLLTVARELLSDWLSLDSKLLRSLRALVRPGRLSELYVAGKRAPYLRPFRLYLVASLLLFSTVLTLDPPDPSEFDLYIGGRLVGGTAAEGVEFEVAGGSGTMRKSLDFFGDDALFSRAILWLAGDRIDRIHAVPSDRVVEALFLGLRRLMPIALILFVPLLALGLKLLYVRRRARHHLYLDHLVFAVHFQTAFFFALSITWLASQLLRLTIGKSLLAGVVVLIGSLFVYLPMALRRFYGQSRWLTAVKSFALLYVYSQLLGLVVSVAALAAIWNA